MSKIITKWEDMRGKTIRETSLHSKFDDNRVILIFTDDSYCIIESRDASMPLKLAET